MSCHPRRIPTWSVSAGTVGATAAIARCIWRPAARARPQGHDTHHARAGGKCYIESHDEEYIGHFKLKLVEFSPTRLAYEIARRDHKFVDVSFALTANEFEEARPIVEVIFGVKESDGDNLFVDDTF